MPTAFTNKVPKTTKRMSPPASAATEAAAEHALSDEPAAPRRRSASTPRATKRAATASKDAEPPRRAKPTPRRASMALEASRSARPTRKSARKSTQRPRAGALQMRRARVEVHTPKRKAKSAAQSD